MQKVNYKKIKALGQGSYGKVYLVEHPTKKKLFAIKTIDLNKLEDDEERKSALIESELMPKLNHPNIIKFEESFVMKDRLCTVMEFAEGGDLSKRIKAQKESKKYFDENQILDWFTQICLGVKHLHDRKVLHRDLKSENIFLTKNNLIKLGDFGTCKSLSFTLQKASTFIGTYYYISPEILRGDYYSFSCDIWSIGVILYEMTCLELPFKGRGEGELTANILNGRYKNIPSHFSQDLRNLIKNLLNTKADKRMRVHDILKLPLIQDRIKVFLSDVEYNDEFSHTIIHKYNDTVTDSYNDDRISVLSNSSIGSVIGPSNTNNDNSINGDKELIVFTKTINKASPENRRDCEDFVNAHKMFVELQEIQQQVQESKRREDEVKLLNDQISQLEIEGKQTEHVDEPIKHEDLRTHLEKTLGKDLLQSVCKTLDEKLPKNLISFRKDMAMEIIINSYSSLGKTHLELILNFIPEIFTFVIDMRINSYKSSHHHN